MYELVSVLSANISYFLKKPLKAYQVYTYLLCAQDNNLAVKKSYGINLSFLITQRFTSFIYFKLIKLKLSSIFFYTTSELKVTKFF